MRSILRSLVAAALVAALAAPVRAADTPEAPPRSVPVAYVLGIGATLGPMYAAKAMVESAHGDVSPAAMGVMVSGLCLGPSVAYAYGRSWRYALVSGLLKSAALAGAVAIDAKTLRQDQGHAWLSTFVAGGVAVWSVVDLIRLGSVVEENNRRLSPPLALAPLVTPTGGGLVVAGRF
jgi:hypothetical protein